MTAHPKLVTFAIGLGITVAIGTAIEMLDNNHNLAFASGSHGGNGNAHGGNGNAHGGNGVEGNDGTSNACTHDGAAEHNPNCNGGQTPGETAASSSGAGGSSTPGA